MNIELRTTAPRTTYSDAVTWVHRCGLRVQEIAPLIDAYIRMIGPSRLVNGIRRRIKETRLSAESAVVEEAEAIAGAIQAQAQPGMSADDRASRTRRADEVREIGRRLVRNLTHTPFRNFAVTIHKLAPDDVRAHCCDRTKAACRRANGPDRGPREIGR